MDHLPAIGRRRALGLGLGAAALAVLGPRTLAGASSSSSTPSASGASNLVANPSFEDGAPGTTAPGWTFH